MHHNIIKYNKYVKTEVREMKEIKRVILKLSGEALAGENKSGYNDELITDIAGQVKRLLIQE